MKSNRNITRLAGLAAGIVAALSIIAGPALGDSPWDIRQPRPGGTSVADGPFDPPSPLPRPLDDSPWD